MSWSERDDDVVPWITLRKSNKTVANGEDVIAASTDVMQDASATKPHDASTAAAAQHNHTAGQKRKNNKSMPCKILSLLSTRERVGQGVKQCGHAAWLREGLVVTDVGLARAGAWYVVTFFVLLHA